MTQPLNPAEPRRCAGCLQEVVQAVKDTFQRYLRKKFDELWPHQLMLTCAMVAGNHVAALWATNDGKTLPVILAGLVPPGISITFYCTAHKAVIEEQVRRLRCWRDSVQSAPTVKQIAALQSIPPVHALTKGSAAVQG